MLKLPNAPEKTDLALGAVVILVGLGHAAYYFPRVVDDLFISLRYAENLAAHHGAVYNLGERVEGYSSPLWMLAQAFGIWLGAEGVLWTKCLGLLSLCGLELALFSLSRHYFGVRGWLAWLPSYACASNSYVVNWSVLGLETPLHLLLVVACPRLVQIALTSARRETRVFATLGFVGLGLSRPESPLYLLLNGLAVLVAAHSRDELRTRAVQCLRLMMPAAIVLSALLALRWVYYGYPVANTYFVKGAGQGLTLENLAPLVGQGVGVAEMLVYLLGLAALLYHGFYTRQTAVLLTAIGCSYFVLSVKLDWMPSLRHLLVLTVLAPVGLAWLAQTAPLPTAAGKLVVRWGSVALLVLSASWVAQVDNRNSPEENRRGSWIRAKSLAKLSATLLAYSRREPTHVTRMPGYEMGQITQIWHVLEASAEPVSESWFMGRDIGAVGYYTGVNVFDTAGLVTAEVSHDGRYRNKRVVSASLLELAFARRPLAGEVYEGWDIALGKAPELLTGYRLRRGNKKRPIAFLAVDRPPPSGQEVVARYRAMVGKFPQSFHLHTLYGESVGAAVERRLRIVSRATATESVVQ